MGKDRSTPARLDEEREFVKILYYGEAKRGKTTALAGLARLGHTIHIDAESGLKRRPLEQHGVPVGNIEPFRTIEFKALEELALDLRQQLEADPDCIVGIVWDSLTETQKLLIEAIANHEVKKAAAARMEKDPYMIEKGWYGKNAEQMRRLIRKFRDLPCHVGFSALLRRDQDKDGEVSYGPALTPAIATDIQGYVDIVAYTMTRTYGDEDYYIATFRPFDKYNAGDRFNALPRVLVNPSFDRIIAYVNGELTVEADDAQQAFMQARQDSLVAT